MHQPKVLALVLNWNRPDDTRRCVESLRASVYDNLDVLVVDNGSQPDSYARLRREVASADFVRSETNLGFAAGNNIGLRQALSRGADYVLLINNDTTVDPGMIGRLVDAALDNPQAGLIGPVIYFMDRPDDVWFGGYRFTHGIYFLRRGLHLAAPVRPVEEVDFVSGCGVLVPRHVIDTVGLFSEDYFMYYEDLDLCFRVKAAGLKILCVTGASMWHAVSASSGGPDSPIKQYYQVKSSLIFYRRYSRGFALWLNVALRFLHAGFTFVRAVLTGRLRLAAVRMFVVGVREGMRHVHGGPRG